jgi:hypothetical protein
VLQPVASWRFPLYHFFAVSPSTKLDHHLVHTVIPERPQMNSLGVFLDSSDHLLASFAARVSDSNDSDLLAERSLLNLSSPSSPRKAGYAAPNTWFPKRNFGIACRFTPSRSLATGFTTNLGLREARVHAYMPLQIALTS